MGVAKSDSLRCVGADQIFIENAERFARIDLDLSDFEKERTHYDYDDVDENHVKEMFSTFLRVLYRL